MFAIIALVMVNEMAWDGMGCEGRAKHVELFRRPKTVLIHYSHYYLFSLITELNEMGVDRFHHVSWTHDIPESRSLFRVVDSG